MTDTSSDIDIVPPTFTSIVSPVREVAEIILSYASDKIIREMVRHLNDTMSPNPSADAAYTERLLHPNSRMWYMRLRQYRARRAIRYRTEGSYRAGFAIPFPPYDCTIPYMDLYYYHAVCTKGHIPTTMGRILECTATQCNETDAVAHTYGRDSSGHVVVTGCWHWRDSVIELLAALSYRYPADCIMAASLRGCYKLVERIMAVYAPGDLAKYRAGDVAKDIHMSDSEDDDEDDNEGPYDDRPKGYTTIFAYNVLYCVIGAMAQSPITLTGSGLIAEGYGHATGSQLRPSTKSIESLWNLYGPTLKATAEYDDEWVVYTLANQEGVDEGAIASYLPTIMVRNAVEGADLDTATADRYYLFMRIMADTGIINALPALPHYKLEQLLASPYLNYHPDAEGWALIDSMLQSDSALTLTLDDMLSRALVARMGTLSDAQIRWFYLHLKGQYDTCHKNIEVYAPRLHGVYSQYIEAADTEASIKDWNDPTPVSEDGNDEAHAGTYATPPFVPYDSMRTLDLELLASHVVGARTLRRRYWTTIEDLTDISTDVSINIRECLLTNLGLSPTADPADIQNLLLPELSGLTVNLLLVNRSSIVTMLLSSLDHPKLLGDIWEALYSVIPAPDLGRPADDYARAMLFSILKEVMLDGMNHIVSLSAQTDALTQQIADASVKGLRYLCQTFDHLVPNKLEWDEIIGDHAELVPAPVSWEEDDLIWPRSYIATRLERYLGGRDLRGSNTPSRDLEVYIMVASVGRSYDINCVVDLLHPLRPTAVPALGVEVDVPTTLPPASTIGTPVELVRIIHNRQHLEVSSEEPKYSALIWSSEVHEDVLDLDLDQEWPSPDGVPIVKAEEVSYGVAL